MFGKQYELTKNNGEHVHVFEVPGCFFNDVQVCLSTTNPADIQKCKYMVGKFKHFFSTIHTELQRRRFTSNKIIVSN